MSLLGDRAKAGAIDFDNSSSRLGLADPLRGCEATRRR